MTKTLPKVSIILVNWNGYYDTIECLSSLESVNYPSVDIIVVDNGSKNESALEIKKAFPDIILIETGTNLGFTGGNNVGIREALKRNADFIMLLNNDTVVDKTFLGPLVEAFLSNQDLGIVGPLIYYYGNRNELWWAGGRFDFWLNFYQETEIPSLSIKRIAFQSGCGMLIKKEVFEKVGFLDEDFFLYYEDTDFCYRAGKAGYLSAVVKDSKIWHKISRSTQGKENPANEYYYVRNKLKFGYKNYQRFFWWLFFIFYTGKILLKFFYTFIRGGNLYGWEGYRDFLNHKWGKYTH